MWVRSQDKKQLYKSFGFEIVNSDIYCLFGTTASKVGSYSTKEKALKVLDMIQESIKGKSNTFFTINSKGGVLKNHEYFHYTENNVFQMPQDSEVE